MAYTGGRYAYKKYTVNSEGARIAQRCYREQDPDLQSTYFYNYNASEVIRLLFFDIDAKYTSAEYKDENGVVIWQKIAQLLKELFPQFLRQIEFVVRSQGKKGIHILMGISPLPLNDKTLPAQYLARKIQSDVISILNFLGIGADFAGTGLKHDFATYRNADNVLHHNRILTKKIENVAKLRPYIDEDGVVVAPKNRPRILNDLSADCDKLLKKLHIKNGLRLYSDRRVEKPLARLFLFLMGMYKQDLLNLFYACSNTVELSINQLEEIMETRRRNFANYIESESFNELFNIEKVSGLFETGRYRLSIKDSKHLDKLIQRAQQVLSSVPSSINFRLIAPEFVEDGFKNTAIVSWALALKWQGVSQELTFVKIQDLVKRIPGYEKSKSCKKSSLRATVQSIFKNRRELQGSKPSESLPSWLEVSNVILLPVRAKSSSTITRSRSIQFPVPRLNEEQDAPPLINLPILIQGLTGDPQNPIEQKMRIVSYKHRVGFFYNNELILVVIKNRHYKLTSILEFIESKILKTGIKFDVLKDVIHMRHNTKGYHDLAKHLYSNDDDLYAVKAQHICGYKKSCAESFEEFRQKSTKRMPSFEDHIKMHEGFNLEYDDSMFAEFTEFQALAEA